MPGGIPSPPSYLSGVGNGHACGRAAVLFDAVLTPLPLARLTGQEALSPDGGTALDFWQWAFSDLRSNVVRGVLAEYLVARALGADLSKPRIAWGNYDFEAGAGWRVEVKSTAYLQSWNQRRVSALGFSRLRGRTWDEVTAAYVGEPCIRADLFVFAVHTCREPAAYNITDLDQWGFYPVDGEVVAAWDADAVGFARVAAASSATPWSDLADAVARVMTG